MKAVCILLQNPYDIDMRVRRKAEALVAAGYAVDVLALRAGRTERTYTLNADRSRATSSSTSPSLRGRSCACRC